jgi:NAD(P)H-hydrate repair Nnr-like enzyme with NAD(P)H-hydrate epimerase domain
MPPIARAAGAASADGLDSGWPAAAREVWLPTADEMARLDQRAVASGATSERVLIETAGRQVARQIQRRRPGLRAVALAGSGHNGADSLVALRTLQTWGWDVVAVACGSRPPEPDVVTGWELEWVPADDLGAVLREADVVLDGLLGTGASGAPRGLPTSSASSTGGTPGSSR